MEVGNGWTQPAKVLAANWKLLHLTLLSHLHLYQIIYLKHVTAGSATRERKHQLSAELGWVSIPTVD